MAMPGGTNYMPTEAEMSLVSVARYESQLQIGAAETRRRYNTVGTLIAIAVLVFSYDLLSVVLGR